MHQASYVERLAHLDDDCSFETFRSRRHELAWVTHTRPDICATVAIMSQVTSDTFERKHIKTLNDGITLAKTYPKRGLRQQSLDAKSLRIVAFSDSSFANLHDQGTQLGYIVLLVDKDMRFNWLQFASYKCKRVVRSVLAGETYAFVDGFDMAYTLRHDLRNIISKDIPLTLVTDSESLFKVIVKSTTTTERRLMIDVKVAREAYARHDISDVGWLRSHNNPADGLTKIGKCTSLTRLLDTGVLQLEVEQWVIRTTDDDVLNKSSNNPIFDVAPATDDTAANAN